MARKRLWIGNNQYGTTVTTGDFAQAVNWRSISVRNPTYRWTAYGGGTVGSYYLELAAGGDPSIAQPDGVELRGAAMTYQADHTTLTAEKWSYGSVGGFSTVVVHAGGSDPDEFEIDAFGLIDLPEAGDTLVLSRESEDDMTTNLDRSATTYAKLLVLEGCDIDVGSSTDPLRLTLSGGVTWSSSGTGYLDLRASNVDVEVEATGGAGAGSRGLYLIGSDLASVEAHGGQVGIGWRPEQTASVDVVRVAGASASVWVSDGVTIGEYYQTGGSDCRLLAACDDVKLLQGNLLIDGSGAIADLLVRGGVLLLYTTGDVTLLTLDNGSVDMLGCAAEREVTTLVHNGGTLRVDPSVVQIGTYTPPSRPAAIGIVAV